MFIQNFVCSQPRYLYRRIDKVNVNSFIVLFNFQGAFVSASRRLDYYITFASLCQGVFKNFFKFFSLAARRLCATVSLTALLLYHTVSTLSSTFFKFFKIFLKRFLSKLCGGCPQTALSLYHLQSRLSSVFLRFFVFSE